MEDTQDYTGNLIDHPIQDDFDYDTHQIDSSNGFEMEPALGAPLDPTLSMGDQKHEDDLADSTMADEKLVDPFPEKEPLPQEEESSPQPDSSVNMGECVSCPVVRSMARIYHMKTVNDLLLWKNIPITIGVLIVFIYTAFSMALMSILSVIGYYGLGIITCHLAIRLYGKVLDTLGKPHAANFYPFQLLDKISKSSWELPEESVANAVRKAVKIYNHFSGTLRDIIMVRSYMRTLKAAALLYFLTWIGSIFNLMTLVIIAVLNLFYIPLLFAKFDKEIAAALNKAKDQYHNVINIIIQKAPFMAKFLDCKTKTS